MANQMYIKFEGIDGEAREESHDKWSKVLGYSISVSQPVSGVGGTAGRTGGEPDFGDLTITKVIDNATPDLNIKCAKGEHIPKVELEITQATGDKHTFMKYTLENCIITSVAPGGSSSDEVKPIETVSVAYGKITWAYTPIDDTGAPGSTTERIYNLELGKQE
ncbi:MAG: type VI secretion system tube protein Hcp [Thiohalocapsa sp.]